MAGAMLAPSNVAAAVNRGNWRYFTAVVSALNNIADREVASPEHEKALEKLVIHPPRVSGIATVDPLDEIPTALVRCRNDIGATMEQSLTLAQMFRDFCWQDRPELWTNYSAARRSVENGIEWEVDTADTQGKQITMRYLAMHLDNFVATKEFSSISQFGRIKDLSQVVAKIAKEYESIPECPDGFRALLFPFSSVGRKADADIHVLNHRHNKQLLETLSEIRQLLQEFGPEFRRARNTSLDLAFSSIGLCRVRNG